MASAKQLRGASRVDGVAGQQIPHQAPAQQDVIAELPGALDGFLCVGKSPVRLAGEVVSEAECAEGFDEQPVVAELASELHRLFPKLPCLPPGHTAPRRSAAVTSAATNRPGSARASGRSSAGTSSARASSARDRVIQ